MENDFRQWMRLVENTLREGQEDEVLSPYEINRKWSKGQNLTPAEAIVFKGMVRDKMHPEIDQRTGDNPPPTAKEEAATKWQERQTEQLKHILLSHGGSTASMDPDDSAVTKLIERGFIMSRRGIKFMKGKPINCHSNTSELWYKKLARICTGYSLARDGMWRQHSWGLTEQDEIIETTTRGRIGYFGIVLTDEESKSFYQHNPPR